MIGALGPLVFAALVVTAEPRDRNIEVGEPVTIYVGASGTAQTRMTLTPPEMPSGLQLGPSKGSHIERRLEVVNRQQVQIERLVWQFDVTATRAGRYTVPAFTVSNGVELASSRPFEMIAAGEFDARQAAFIETRIDPRPRYVGEPVTVAVAFGVAPSWTLENQDTTLAVRWMFDGVDGAVADSESSPRAGERGAEQFRTTSGQALAMTRGAEDRRDGRYATWIAKRRFVPTKPGSLTFRGTQVSAKVGQGLKRSRIGIILHEVVKLAVVDAEPVTILVKPLPDVGRSEAFSGYVGKLALEVRAGPAGAGTPGAPIRVKVGESLRLSLTVSGEGNVATTALPRFDIPGFKRFGVVEEVAINEDPPSRTLTYDLAAESMQVREIPPISLEVFDTQSGSYRTLTSAPIPIQVLPGASLSKLADPLPDAAPPVAVASPSIVELVPGGMLGIAGALAVPVVALAAFAMMGMGRARKEKQKSAVPPPAALRRSPPPPRRAFSELLEDAPATGPERAKAIADAFSHHLASLAGVPAETFVGADLEDALAPFIADRALRREAAALAAEADRCAFGGVAPARDLGAKAAALAGRLERAFAVRPNPKR